MEALNWIGGGEAERRCSFLIYVMATQLILLTLFLSGDEYFLFHKVYSLLALEESITLSVMVNDMSYK